MANELEQSQKLGRFVRCMEYICINHFKNTARAQEKVNDED